jgi:lipopolysaccharide export LptBFGC system permease protein LptF
MSTHRSAKDMQSETKSSAWTFLLVGSGGFLIITLALIGFIKLPFSIFSLAIMEIMFFIFLIVAGLSFKKAISMLDDISKESTLEEKISDWAKENLTPESLTVDLDENTTSEMKYFMVTELMRERMMLAFPELDDAYAEELAEHYYNELFPEG